MLSPLLHAFFMPGAVLLPLLGARQECIGMRSSRFFGNSGACRLGLYNDCGGVTKNFSKASHQFRGVVAHGDDCIIALLLSVLAHKSISLRARLFAKVRVDGDVATE